MKKILSTFLAVLFLWVANSYADPYITSNNSYAIGTTQPTHCYLYLDGGAIASLKEVVATNLDGSVFCHIDLAPMAVGNHTAKISAVVETGGVMTSESAKFDIPLIAKNQVTDVGLPYGWKYQIGTQIAWIPK